MYRLATNRTEKKQTGEMLH